MDADHPQRIGPYRIEERLGAGGMGTVYRAYDERLRRRVALKQIHPERARRPGARERFLREARAVARLNHPALVHLHDILETDDGDWIVMELVEGPSLARLLKAGPLDPDRALRLARDVAGGLAAAHAAGILHRDLKTENVVVTRDGRAKLLDFGLAVHVEAMEEQTWGDDTLNDETRDDETLGDPVLTGAGRIVGTPRAMSPEQARGHQVDHRSDLFSLGVFLYEMMAGCSPFLGPGPAETLARVCHEEQDPACEHAPDVPRELSDLIDRLLRKEPEARPASAVEVVEALEEVARDRPSEELATSAPAVQEPAVPELVTVGQREPFQFRGERRQLTLLCCELTGASLDPEDLFEVLRPFQAVVNEAIERYEGHLRDVQGHRFVALFGYPRSHEDNARRAVLTALQIVERIEPIVQGFKVRAGIHTGPAVILHRVTGEHLTLGATLDLATALQERAEPGRVLVSSLTRRLVAGFFEDEAVDAEDGAADAENRVEAFRVVAARNVHNRVEASEDLTPFVGRERELALLAGRFALAREEGVGQAVLMTGVAGVGKSRLLHELRERLGEAEPRWVSGHGSPYARNVPLQPIGGFLRDLLEVDGNASGEQQLARLEDGLTEHQLPPEEMMSLFATHLGLPGGKDMDLFQLRRETLEAVPALFQEVAERRPLVVAFEDLHRADPITLELIGRMVDGIAAAALLLVLTSRPGFRLPWERRAKMTQLRLAPLDRGEIDQLIGSLAAGDELPDEIRERIIERADGVPLFAEELVWEAWAVKQPEDDAVPATLRDLLAARLDRLGSARDVALLAAGLGREVSREELAAVGGLAGASLGQDLDRLVAAEILAQPSGTICRFEHNLVREVAIESFLLEDQKSLSRSCGGMISSPF